MALGIASQLSGLAHNTSTYEVYTRGSCVCVPLRDMGLEKCYGYVYVYVYFSIYMYIYIYNGLGENPIFGSLKFGCPLRGVTGLQVCRLLPSQLFI
jgi:hypothetical protein